MKSYTQYFYATLGFISFVLSLILLINSLIDPLRYFRGNILFNENYSFNERISKTNLYLKSPKKYDCILFGSSRVTLLNAEDITKNKCFNFSFADGNPSEFLKYAAYINKYGGPLDRVIIGLDARFFSRQDFSSDIPEFIENLNKPDVFFKPYISFSIIDFSFRTLMKDPPQQRYYDNNFIGQVLTNTQSYTPPECYTLDGFGRPYSTSRLHYLAEIRNTINPQLFIGYVPPISAWELLPLLEDGEINSRIKLLYQASKSFDEFYDFSVPSAITERTDTSYDGHHFYPNINKGIANTLNTEATSFGLAVHKMSFKKYKQSFIYALESFKAHISQRKASSDSCLRRTAAR